jgi:hypothetical protein
MGYNYTGRDYYTLLAIAKANESVPDDRFSMDQWLYRQHCGTVACLMGNYVLSTKDERFSLNDAGGHGIYALLNGDDCLNTSEVGDFLGISVNMSRFLFACDDNGTIRYFRGENCDNARPDSSQTRRRAIDRIYKLVNYLQKKDALMCGGTPEYEAARQSEGDLRIDREVVLV